MKKELILLLIFLSAFQLSAFNAIAEKTGYYSRTDSSNKTALTSKEKILNASNDLLQFRSSGLILGFKPDRVYMAGMGYLLTEEFIGTSGAAPVAGDIQGRKNRAKKGAPDFTKVSYPNLWPGITVNYEAKQGGIAESTYIIEPYADASRIRLKYNGEAKIQKDGSLKFKHPAEKGYFTMSVPIAWQEIEGKKVKVNAAFNEYQDSSFGFKVGRYDKQYPLIIDPTYQWHAFYGSASDDYGYSIAVDASGNVYVTGYSNATWGSPVHPHSGGMDIVVIKLNNSGIRQWHTFLGSASDDRGYGIAVDAGENVYVTGEGNSPWLGTPVHSFTYGGGPNIVAFKLNNSGVLQWHTFHGSGSGDYGNSIALDNSGNVYITGASDAAWGSPVNAHSGGRDIIILKLNYIGVLQWHTFNGSALDDRGFGIAVDAGGNVYVTGWSLAAWGSPVNAYSGSGDIVVLKLNSTGARQWHTFHGSASFDYGSNIAVDNSGNIYVTGRSDAAWGLPVNAHSGSGDIVVLKLNSTGARQWHTFHGSASFDYGGRGIAIDNSGNVYITAESDAAWGSPVHAYNGGYDIMILKLNSTGARQWHTFYGSALDDYARGITADSSGNVYVAGYSSATWGLPLNAHSGGWDIVALKLADDASTGDAGDSGEGSGGGGCAFVYDVNSNPPASGMAILFLLLPIAWLFLRRMAVRRV